MIRGGGRVVIGEKACSKMNVRLRGVSAWRGWNARGQTLQRDLMSDGPLSPLLEPFTCRSATSAPPDWRCWQKESDCFSSLFSLLPPFSSLLSICPLVCLICFLPEEETIFWMSPVLINCCQRPPCSADSCSEWQIMLCHGETVGEEGRQRDVGRLSVLACDMWDGNRETFASIHCGQSLESGWLCQPYIAEEITPFNTVCTVKA